MRASYAVAPITADVLGQGSEGMFEPRLANLFEAVVVAGATAHPIHILRDDWMVVTRQLKPIQVDGAGMARRRSKTSPTNPPLLAPVGCLTAGRSPTITSGPGTLPTSG